MANNKKKNEVSLLVQGLGMGMAFLQVLHEELVAGGGFGEMIHFLTKERARPLAKKIAKMIVESEWQVPLSLMEKLAWKASQENGSDSQYYDRDSKYYWRPVCQDFGIPVVEFRGEGHGSCEPVPKEIINQLAGKKICYPTIILWQEERHVVVGVSGSNFTEDMWEEGKILPKGVMFTALDLSPAKFFNLEQ
jgi:hypothetical protein